MLGLLSCSLLVGIQPGAEWRQMSTCTAAPESLRGRVGMVLAVVAFAALAGPASSLAAPKPAVLTFKTAQVGAPGNPSVGIVPFADAIYRNCAEAPQEEKAPACQMVGAVKYRYGIGQLEVTVAQWVAFLNTADPLGRNRHKLYSENESAAAWPKFGQIDFSSGAAPGRHYTVASPEWADKPYGFANFLRAARFVNSLYNGRLLSKRASSENGFAYVTYKVRLSPRTERGMYDMRKRATTRGPSTGFVLPSQNEWIKAAYYDPSGGGTYSYWKYPTNPGVFGDGTATAPAPTTLNPENGDVTNSSTQPLATYHASAVPAPSWCPAAIQPQEDCASVNPLGLSASAYAKAYQGSLSTVGQAKTLSPWGTLDQGGNAVEWTDTITAPPSGRGGPGRVWRRLHGGIANAGAYQLWLSAVGLQPQDDTFFTATYPWLCFRIGVVGNLQVGEGGARAAAARRPGGHRSGRGTLKQLPGAQGCLVDRSAPAGGCGKARALQGPGPFMGSRAIALSPDGRNAYVASSRSDAVAVFARDAKSGALTQLQGTAGCVAAEAAEGCAAATGLNGPNSVALSPDGRNVYATSRESNSIAVFRRNPATGALSQLPGAAGCISGLPIPGCGSGRALVGPDVVTVSPDGNNVYVGSFFGNEVAVFARDQATGALTQLSGTAGCVAETSGGGCAVGLALGAPEGMAISGDGNSVYVASALSNAVAVFSRNPSSGALTQATDGSGCIVNAALAGCVTGLQLGGANAVAVSPGDDDVYVTSLLSNSVTSFGRAGTTGALAQKEGTAGCLVYLRAAGCSFGRALVAPEGLAVSSDGANVYAAAFKSGAIDVLSRNRRSGAVEQLPGTAGCQAPPSLPGCTRARALRGVSSIALSADGRYLYSTSFGSNAVDIFRRGK